MNKKSELSKNRFPFIVTISDEILSLSDIDRYKNELKLLNAKVSTYRLFLVIVGLGIVLSMAAGTMASITILLSLDEIHLPLNNDNHIVIIYILTTASILFLTLVVIRSLISRKLDAINKFTDCNELDLIDSDPSACKELTRWIGEFSEIKMFAEKISTKNRLPTLAEYHCMERWIFKKQNEGPVENLRNILSLNNTKLQSRE